MGTDLINFAILCNDLKKQFSWKQKPFVKESLNECYEFFSKSAKHAKTKVFISTVKNYSGKKLKRAWFFEKGKWQIAKNVPANAVLDKFKFGKKNNLFREKISKQLLLINNPKLEFLCKDKWLFYKTFSKFCPKTFLAKNKAEFNKVLKKISSRKIVLKPRFGLAGQKISILKRERNFFPKSERIAQEFIETKKGIPELGIIGRHDLRILVLNGKICFAFARIPEKHRLIANVSKGGKVFRIKKPLPAKVKNLVKKIDSKLSKFGFRFYSADFLKSRKRYFLIELNSKPSFQIFLDTNSKKIAKKFFKKFFEKIAVQLNERMDF